MLGNDVAPVGGADMGWLGKGLGGIPLGDLWFPHLHEQSVCSLLGVDSAESSSEEVDPDLFPGKTGEGADMALRKSI